MPPPAPPPPPPDCIRSELQDEVAARAQEMQSASPGDWEPSSTSSTSAFSSSYDTSSGGLTDGGPDLTPAPDPAHHQLLLRVDALRGEVAATRAVLQQLKLTRQEQQQPHEKHQGQGEGVVEQQQQRQEGL